VSLCLSLFSSFSCFLSKENNKTEKTHLDMEADTNGGGDCGLKAWSWGLVFLS